MDGATTVYVKEYGNPICYKTWILQVSRKTVFMYYKHAEINSLINLNKKKY